MKLSLLAAIFSVLAVALPAGAFGDIYLVRHAEKEYGDNPPLSPAGRKRADALAKRMSNTGLEKIYSTNYERTLKTAEPAARQRGLIVEQYDPRDLKGFAESLKEEAGETRGAILVVGHSNTTPYLVQLLSGQEQAPLEEHHYNRLYVLRPNIKNGGYDVFLEYFEP